MKIHNQDNLSDIDIAKYIVEYYGNYNNFAVELMIFGNIYIDKNGVIPYEDVRIVLATKEEFKYRRNKK